MHDQRTRSRSAFYWRLQRLGFGSYDEYLRGAHWQDVRRRYRESNRPQVCDWCGETKVHLHHKTYARLGAELLTDLVPLCAVCHATMHTLERGGHATLDPGAVMDAERAAANRLQAAAIGARRAREDADNGLPEDRVRRAITRARVRGHDVSRVNARLESIATAMERRVYAAMEAAGEFPDYPPMAEMQPVDITWALRRVHEAAA